MYVHLFDTLHGTTKFDALFTMVTNIHKPIKIYHKVIMLSDIKCISSVLNSVYSGLFNIVDSKPLCFNPM